jgi:hypothetical protein
MLGAGSLGFQKAQSDVRCPLRGRNMRFVRKNSRVDDFVSRRVAMRQLWRTEMEVVK